MDLPLLSAPPRPDGLAWAVAFVAGTPRDCGNPRPPGGPGWDWLHYDIVPGGARAAIEAETGFPPFIRRLLTGPDETPRIVTDGRAVAGVLPSFVLTAGTGGQQITRWRFAMLPDRIVTCRRHPVRVLAAVREGLGAGRLPDGPVALLDGAIAEFAHEARRRVAALDDDLDAAEDVLLDQGAAANLSGLGARLGQTRRELTSIKRALTPLARLMAADAEELPAWTMRASHETAHAAVVGTLDDIGALHDRARSLHDELAARQAEETNRRLYIVSLVTTVVMPAALLTGFFGMNTGGLPWQGHGFGTLYATSLCVVAMVVTFLALRWKRLL